ncbi:MAG TPA: Obg family GTPase CgtA, partial [Acidiferrobacteraceae bacterium]|nr:Obg family GTPase CgtA [Acidiferrobacteraceae bacterium]HEX19419.1 Obg family GTPase CgtA [Acidiferrobacteraceae bacterium]
GSVYLAGDQRLNTLVDFRHTRMYRAQHGGGGKPKLCTGKNGEDLMIAVPLGTKVTDVQSGDYIGEITEDGQTLLVAQGGQGGLGNTHFKSSTNRAPRKTRPGTPGEQRKIALELQVLADVGLLGLPNAGKSTFLRAVSSAQPKVADYPFTTLYPNLGVVRVGNHRSFVVADIPGLIEGAAEGAGLGIQFLRHLSRTLVLLHIVDMAPLTGDGDPLCDARAIIEELHKFNPELAQQERWLVLNKMDLIPEDEREARCQQLLDGLGWQGPVYKISAISKEGCRPLVGALMDRLEALRKEPQHDD